MSPLVSVVVPVFNGLPYLREALESVLSQTYRDLELVIADGGSTDGSQSLIDQIVSTDARVRRVDGARGAAANWTAVTTQARGEYIKLLCQDDRLAPEAIAKQVSDLQGHPKAVMAVGQRDIIDSRGNVLRRARGLGGLPAGEHEAFKLVEKSYMAGTNIFGEPLCILFRASSLLQALPWDSTQKLVLDLGMYQRLCRPNTRVVVRRDVVGAFRVSPSSWSTRLAREQFTEFRAWQLQIEAAYPTYARLDRSRALVGAACQVFLRRAAYAALRFRDRLGPTS